MCHFRPTRTYKPICKLQGDGPPIDQLHIDNWPDTAIQDASPYINSVG